MTKTPWNVAAVIMVTLTMTNPGSAQEDFDCHCAGEYQASFSGTGAAIGNIFIDVDRRGRACVSAGPFSVMRELGGFKIQSLGGTTGTVEALPEGACTCETCAVAEMDITFSTFDSSNCRGNLTFATLSTASNRLNFRRIGGRAEDCVELARGEDCVSAPQIAQWRAAGGGQFESAASWGGELPAGSDSVLFAEGIVRGGTVEVAASHANDSLRVRDDSVIFEMELITYELTESADCLPGLLVSDPSGAALKVFRGVIETPSAIVGDSRGEVGSVELEDAGLQVSEILTVGLAGTGELTVDSESGLGTEVRCAQAIIGARAEADGTVSLGKASTLETSKLVIGRDATATGSMALDGRGLSFAEIPRMVLSGSSIIGDAGVGSLEIDRAIISTESSDVEAQSEPIAIIGAQAGSDGTVQLSAAAVWRSPQLEIGQRGFGDLFIRTGSSVFSPVGVIGSLQGARGAVTLEGGGRWVVSQTVFVGLQGSAVLNIDDDSELRASNVVVGAQGQINADNMTVGGSQNTVTPQGLTGDLEPANPGVRIESLTIEPGGRVQVARFELAEGGSFDGDGALTGTVVNSGMLSPGADACRFGVITLDGDYLQGAAGSLRIRLGGLSAGDQHDQLAVDGIAELSGTLQVEAVNGFAPRAGDRFEVLTAAAVVGEFDHVDGDGAFEVTYAEDRVMLTLQSPMAPGDGGCPQTAPPDEIEEAQEEFTDGGVGACGAMGTLQLLLMFGGMAGWRTRRRC